MAKKQFFITAEEGLHARPAAALVSEANRFHCELSLEFKDRTVNLKSILGVMGLGIPTRSTITIHADGQDAQEAILGTATLLEAQGMINSGQ
ncbi:MULTISPECIES: HPr family phosphocarrier protein [unclassified Planococcus (in: firmicutes)]|uniref:HPr family phosphocarrier protein n=1 Tax=unclassified Planococcus (in: firmicutes) TaxID=2662419 RepID=UPI000C7B7134|nr:MULTISPECIES: HPr family phosphocarrier protein [unclassified Planococcus (in: firmicutes)]PKG45581.1 phosphocarrier protein HPr [Planococcus sp. Urea-trap-24]PKG88710.1 phosphocarrier protein HPr [Planococcus sp. Urea-3u-39]PKH38572.1 phosphocarrier protein HPr [Planococcus sp. MB-3u-09]